MKKLIDPATFADRYFDEACRPDVRTVRAWVREGHVPGREIGARVFVDAAAFERQTGDPLADRVLERG